MRKSLNITFDKGIQPSAKLGTLNMKLAGEGRAGYAQNVDLSSDEYGNGVAVPGPALTTIGNNSELTGVPIMKVSFSESSTPRGFIYLGQGALGTLTTMRRVKDVLSGSTPTLDTSITNNAISHSGHTNLTLVDMVLRPVSNGSADIYVAVKDDTDTTVHRFSGATTSDLTATVVATNTGFTSGLTDQFLVFSTFDNNLYWIGANRIDSINVSNTHTPNVLALGLPVNTYASCGVEWQQQLLVGYTNALYGGFAQRKVSGKSGLVIWDFTSPAITRNVPAPCRYISVLINAPNGNLLVFGGVDEGKSSLYLFTGYGFQLLTQYIGDMPRSRHSVEFDAQGRILWMTVDGQLCRFDLQTGKFEHLGTISTGSSAGGILAKGIGSPTGNEFFVASGSGSTYTLKKVQFGSYIGDGGGSDGVTTPLIVAGSQILPKGSTIEDITLALGKPLETGEKIELRVYKNGSTTDYQVYFTMDYSVDGGVSMKKESITISDINSFNLAVAWKQTDGATTAPPVVSAQVTIETIYG